MDTGGGAHEPIISREIWDTVVSIDKKKVRKTPPADGIRSIFTGLVYCADCGFKMRNHIERFTYKDGTPGRYSSFICGNYARSGKSACTITPSMKCAGGAGADGHPGKGALRRVRRRAARRLRLPDLQPRQGSLRACRQIINTQRKAAFG